MKKISDNIQFSFTSNPFGNYAGSNVTHYLLSDAPLPILRCDDRLISVLGIDIDCYHSNSWMIGLNGLNPCIEGKLSTFFAQTSQQITLRDIKNLEKNIVSKGYYDIHKINAMLKEKLNPKLLVQVTENFVENYIKSLK